MGLAVRTWLRYLVPLTLLSALALAPIVWLALEAAPPLDAQHARAQLRLGWMLAAGAWVCQLWLVAAVAPAVRSLARDRPLSQVCALWSGLGGLVRGAIPCAVAVAAILIGGLALVAPGVMLLVLLSLTGASEQLAAPPPAALADSVDVARAQLTRITVLVLAMIVVDVAIAYAAQVALVPALVKNVTVPKLAHVHTFVRAVAFVLVVVSPGGTCALAAAYARSRTR